MDRSHSLPPFNNSTFTAMKEITPLNQVMTFKAFNMQRVIQVVQRVAQKSCRRACQLFCCPLDILWCQKVTCCSAQNHQLTEDKTTQVALRSPPSTILIVNISNSTLIDCVIGNDTYPSAVAESQPLMQDSRLHMHDQMRSSYSHGQQGAARTSPPPPPPPPPLYPLPPEEPPSISIHGSHLNCVIIGDNNYMHAEQIHPTETEEPRL
ncbi:WASH complex subunit 1-like [Seriola dumerili]|uniref:WASH complex subunit 1-like n=1 Tax=Seriola dumerili TaxID=41447 RepID=UPI000BBE17E4|nr:WASH complex subunit 1-like [Seriola dumerili]